MSELLLHLSKDTLPLNMVKEFVNWCVWQQAKPALVVILEHTGLEETAAAIVATTDLANLAVISQDSGKSVHNQRPNTGPLGLSTAEATLFLVSRMATAASESDWDPEGVAFFSAQVCGWAGFAQASFSDATRKVGAEQAARQQQEEQLAKLLEKYSQTHSDS